MFHTDKMQTCLESSKNFFLDHFFHQILTGVMKTAVKTNVDSVDSVDGWRPRLTVDQNELVNVLVDVDQ